MADVRDLVQHRIDAVQGREDARLSTGPRGGRITTAVLRDATHWDEVVSSLGLEHLRRHALRHTGLTWMADAGVPVHVLRVIAGHGSLTTTQRYLHPTRHSITDAGDALTAHLRAPRSPNGPHARSAGTRDHTGFSSSKARWAVPPSKGTAPHGRRDDRI
ncbi:tyrosine-type recombinase/integrase [Pseudonocardia sp.]|uniref:tyrosine-type recombinase/integrase n=1 Tax=Pseudonocardia sp. TaxID=60912 RepID=UPI00261BFA47|nr:tyrosine-type recombinase/integrase [Pseudonocardia sp.]